MKVAINDRPDSFSVEWIRYCIKHNVDYKLVNCYDSNIIKQLEGCSGLMWHWSHIDSKAVLFARQLIYSLEKAGLKVFPDSKTCWHFDDKVGQKYLLEAINAPLVPSEIFYDKKQAMIWADQTTYPKIFKLRGGAGSENVKLVRSKNHAYRLIRRAFSRGFRSVDKLNRLSDKFHTLLREWNSHNLALVLKESGHIIYPRYDDRMKSREKGYIYFQEFVADKNYDTRITVIGGRALGLKRYTRKNDFRASGSGNMVLNRGEISLECVKSALYWANKLDVQCVNFDFITDKEPVYFVEISYGFAPRLIRNCPGYWDKNMVWHEGEFIPEWFMIEDFINKISG